MLGLKNMKAIDIGGNTFTRKQSW